MCIEPSIFYITSRGKLLKRPFYGAIRKLMAKIVARMQVIKETTDKKHAP